MFCTKCGANCDDISARGGKFCVQCGTPLPASVIPATTNHDPAPIIPATTNRDPAPVIPATASDTPAPVIPAAATDAPAREDADAPLWSAPVIDPSRPAGEALPRPDATAYRQATQGAQQAARPAFSPGYPAESAPVYAGTVAPARRKKWPWIALACLLVAGIAVACLFIFGVIGGSANALVGQWAPKGQETNVTLELTADGDVYTLSGSDRAYVGSYTVGGDKLTWIIPSDSPLFSQFGSEQMNVGNISLICTYSLQQDTLTLRLSKFAVGGMEMDASALAQSGMMPDNLSALTLQRVKSNA